MTKKTIVVSRLPKCDVCWLNGVVRIAGYEVMAASTPMNMCGMHASRHPVSALTPLVKAT